jgi:hypothetical protein
MNLSILAVIWAYYGMFLHKFLALQFHLCHPKYTSVSTSIVLYAPFFFFEFFGVSSQEKNILEGINDIDA